MLRGVVANKILLDTKGKMKNMILSVDRGEYGMCKVNIFVTYMTIKEKNCGLRPMYEKINTNIPWC